MSKLEEDIQAVAFISNDGLSFMVPVSRLPEGILRRIILGLEEDAILPFEPSAAQIEAIRIVKQDKT